MSHHSTLPVETIEEIIAFALCPGQDDPQRLPSPSSRAHPLSLLLVSAGFTQLVLPHFYRSIFIRRSQDWVTLFNSTDGVLGATARARWLPSLDHRRAWVEELFLGITPEGELVRAPLDMEGARKGRIDAEAIRLWCKKTRDMSEEQASEEAWDQPLIVPVPEVVLPALTHLVIIPLPVVPPPPLPPTKRTRAPKILTELETITQLILALPRLDKWVYGEQDIKRAIHHQQVHFFVWKFMRFSYAGVRTLSYPLIERLYSPWPVKPNLFQDHFSPHDLVCHWVNEEAGHVVYGGSASGLKSHWPALSDVRGLVPVVLVGAEAGIRKAEAKGKERSLRFRVKGWRWREQDGTEVPFLEAWPNWS